jgi:hypothetical protein
VNENGSATPEADPEPGQQSLLKVVKGDPTPEELAALVTVVSSLAAGAAEASARKTPPVPEWAAHHRKVRGVHRHGPGAWRNSAR